MTSPEDTLKIRIEALKSELIAVEVKMHKAISDMSWRNCNSEYKEWIEERAQIEIQIWTLKGNW